MGKFNISIPLIRTLAVALVMLCPGPAMLCALAADDAPAAARQDATRDPIALQENAPDRHIVVPGDTLWGIAGKFLKDPWRWPELWRMNKDQIKSPHRIYPGNIIVLDRSQRQLKLATPIVEHKLDPKARVETTGPDIPSIAPALIEPFLSQPLVIEADGMESAPKIVATQEDRVYVGSGNVAYVTGIEGSSQNLWQVYRPGKPLIDPETKKILGYEAFFLGTARVTREGDPTTVEIISAKQEIGRGDRLIPAARALPLNYVPHAPENFVQGRVISSYGGLNESGRNSIIAINRGTRDGMEIGHVLALYRFGKYFEDSQPAKTRDPAKPVTPPMNPMFTGSGEAVLHTTAGSGGPVYEPARSVRRKFPDERYGLIFVFRVFEQVSYALVLNVSRPVNVDDVVQTP